MTCSQCRPGTGPDAAFCRSCGTSAGSEPPGWTYPFDGRPFPAASVSQFPGTPGDQYIPSAAAGQHGPPAVAPPREFRLDLLLRSGWGEFPFPLPVAHETLLLAGTGAQFLLVLAGFLDVPLAGLGWEIGAYLAVAAAALATLPAALAARRSRPRR